MSFKKPPAPACHLPQKHQKIKNNFLKFGFPNFLESNLMAFLFPATPKALGNELESMGSWETVEPPRDLKLSRRWVNDDQSGSHNCWDTWRRSHNYVRLKMATFQGKMQIKIFLHGASGYLLCVFSPLCLGCPFHPAEKDMNLAEGAPSSSLVMVHCRRHC